MTDPRDPDRLIRAFLAEGGTELPDRAYDAVRSHIDHTRQRVVIGPWREPRMPTIARMAIAAAAVVVVAVVGINLLPSSNLGGIAASSPSIQPSASVSSLPSGSSPAATASPAALVYEWPKPIQAGTYTTQFIWDIPFQVTFTVPDRWESRDVEVLRDPSLSVTFQLVDNVSADPCRQIGRTPKIGPSVDALASALATLPGADTTTPTATTLAGYPGKVLELSVGADAGCPGSQYQLWTNAPGSVVTDRGPMGPLTWGAELPNSRIWILDVDGVRLVISGLWRSGATPADLAELQAVIDSIRIVPSTGDVPDCTVILTDASRPGAALIPPYVVTLGSTTYEKLGMVPSPFPSFGLTAQVDFTTTGDGWVKPGGTSFRPTAGLKGPDGSDDGFATATPVNGLQGSFVFDAPGTWHASIDGVADACPHEFTVVVEATPDAS